MIDQDGSCGCEGSDKWLTGSKCYTCTDGFLYSTLTVSIIGSEYCSNFYLRNHVFHARGQVQSWSTGSVSVSVRFRLARLSAQNAHQTRFKLKMEFAWNVLDPGPISRKRFCILSRIQLKNDFYVYWCSIERCSIKCRIHQPQIYYRLGRLTLDVANKAYLRV